MNTGFDKEREKLDEDERDYVFGANSPKCIALIPQRDRAEYLPVGEVQKGVDDFMDCATRGPHNIIETKFTWLVKNEVISKEKIQWLKDNKYADSKGNVTFSDRFIAMKSGTTKRGNGLKAPADAMHRYGLIPKVMLPAKKTMTWEQYHNLGDITPEMEKLGQNFLARFSITYEKVYIQDFDKIIDEDMIDVALYAWPNPINGEYPKTDKDENHVVVYYSTPRHLIFDNYLDTDGDYIKKLAPNYNLYMYGLRLVIAENTDIEAQKISIMLKIIEAMKQLIQLLSKKVGAWLS